MKMQIIEMGWIDACSLVELAQRSGVPEALLQDLVDCGVLQPCDPDAGAWSFDCEALACARVAARLRNDLELDAAGITVALALLRRITELEAKVRQLQASAPAPA